MTAEMIALLGVSDLNVIKGPKFKKIKFKQTSQTNLNNKWKEALKLNKADKLESLKVGLTKENVGIVGRTMEDKAIKLKNSMFYGLVDSVAQLYTFDESKSLHKDVGVEKPIIEQGEENIQTLDSTMSPIAADKLDLDEIRGAVNQAFGSVTVEKVEDVVVPEFTQEEVVPTKVSKNAIRKAKVDKFGVNYHLNRDGLETSIAFNDNKSVAVTNNNDIFGNNDSKYVMDREFPIVVEERLKAKKENKDSKDKLFHFSEADNSVALEKTPVDEVSKNREKLNQLYNNFKQEMQEEKLSADNSTSFERELKNELLTKRAELLKLAKEKEEQDRRTLEAEQKAAEAEANNIQLVQQVLSSVEEERKALEKDLTASKQQEQRNLAKLESAQAEVKEIAVMFKDTPVNFVIPTKKAA